MKSGCAGSNFRSRGPSLAWRSACGLRGHSAILVLRACRSGKNSALVPEVNEVDLGRNAASVSGGSILDAMGTVSSLRSDLGAAHCEEVARARWRQHAPQLVRRAGRVEVHLFRLPRVD